MKFKINFPSGLGGRNVLDDNIDVNIILENGNVFFATLFTLRNVQNFLAKESYFWSTDMIIVSNLETDTIVLAVKNLLNDGYIESATTWIGDFETVFGEGTTFESLSMELLES